MGIIKSGYEINKNLEQFLKITGSINIPDYIDEQDWKCLIKW